LSRKKPTPTDPTQTTFVWFGSNFYFKSQPNQTKPHTILSYGSIDFEVQNQTKPRREHSYALVTIDVHLNLQCQ